MDAKKAVLLTEAQVALLLSILRQVTPSPEEREAFEDLEKALQA